MKKFFKVLAMILVIVLIVFAVCYFTIKPLKNQVNNWFKKPTKNEASAGTSFSTRLSLVESNLSDFEYRLKFVEEKEENNIDYFNKGINDIKSDIDLLKTQNEEDFNKINEKLLLLENKIENLNKLLNLIFAKVSNPNLLINSDFRINQRNSDLYKGDTEYYDVYSVDRWKLANNAEVRVVENGIILTGTITQIFEKAPTGTLTASVDQSNGTVSAGYENGVFSITANNVLISWAKLEVGEVSTAFSPKTMTEELSDCKRYYQKFGFKNEYEAIGIGQFNTNNTVFASGLYSTEMRVKPTMKLIGELNVRSGNLYLKATKVENFGSNKSFQLSITTSGTQTAGMACDLFLAQNSFLEFDAEIY